MSLGAPLSIYMSRLAKVRPFLNQQYVTKNDTFHDRLMVHIALRSVGRITLKKMLARSRSLFWRRKLFWSQSATINFDPEPIPSGSCSNHAYSVSAFYNVSVAESLLIFFLGKLSTCTLSSCYFFGLGLLTLLLIEIQSQFHRKFQ